MEGLLQLKQALRKKPTQLFLSLGFLGLIGLSFYFYQNSLELKRPNFWTQQEVSADSGYAANLLPTKILSDSFGQERFRGLLDYDLKVSGHGPKQWDDFIEETLERSLLNSSQWNSPSVHLGRQFLHKLIFDFSQMAEQINHSSEPLRVDLIISPRLVQHMGQAQLMREYSVPSLAHRGKLLKSLSRPIETTPQKIYEGYLPDDGETYQVKGSVISLIFPPHEDQQMRATLRLRRYFRVNIRGDLDLRLKDSEIELELTHFHNQRSSNFYVTVDFVQDLSFDQQAIQVKNKRLDYIPGVLLSPNTSSSTGDIMLGLDRAGELRTGELNLRGKIEGTKFESTIEVLSLDLTSGIFNSNESIIHNEIGALVNRREGYGPLEKGRLRQKISSVLLNSHQEDLITSFKLARFIPEGLAFPKQLGKERAQR